MRRTSSLRIGDRAAISRWATDRAALGGQRHGGGRLQKFVTQARAAYVTRQHPATFAALAKNGFTPARVTAALAALDELSTTGAAHAEATWHRDRSTQANGDDAATGVVDWVAKFRRIREGRAKDQPALLGRGSVTRAFRLARSLLNI